MRVMLPIFLFAFALGLPPLQAQAQDATAVSGIPNNSPPAFWPRGFSLEAQTPNSLYPNGPQFGLSTTAGGFGSTGTGPISGIGMAQRSVSPLVREEMQNPYAFNTRLSEEFGRESLRSSNIFSSVLAARARLQVRPATPEYQPSSPGLITPSALPSVDSILQDRPPTTDSILRNSL